MTLHTTAPKKQFFAVAKATEATMYILDEIGGWAGIMAKDVAAALEGMPKTVKNITININSPGGEVFEGNSIHNLLRAHPAQKTVNIVGIAASIASIIAMAGDKIVTAKNALWMIHNPHGIVMGGADDMRKMGEVLDQIRGTLINTYAARTKQTTDDLSRWMSQETWMNADEALARGFTDQVGEEDPKAAQDAKAFAYLRNFKALPQTLKGDPLMRSARLAQVEQWALKRGLKLIDRSAPASNEAGQPASQTI